jgi:hypothetical protein
MSSKRHHYVPIFYLNYFVTNLSGRTPSFLVYDKAGGPARIQTPINTAVQGHLYSFETPSGAKDDSLERALAELETKATPILSRWQNAAAVPTDNETHQISQFLALMHTRSPRTIQGITEARQAIGFEMARFLADQPQLISEFLEHERLAGKAKIPTLEEMIENLRNVEDRFEIQVDRENSLVESLKLSETVAGELLKMNWCLCRAPTGSFFVTSDTPLCVIAKTGGGKALLGTGFSRPNCEVTFPISPHLCLLLDKHHTNRKLAVGKQFVREANKRMAAIAERLVISPYRSNAIAALVTKYSFTRQLPKIDRSEFGRIYQGRLRSRTANIPRLDDAK